MVSNIFHIAILIMLSLPIWGQVDADHMEIDVFVQETLAPTQRRILLEVGYAKDQILNDSLVQFLNKYNIEEVNLYYTDYPKGADLTDLNNRRIQNFHAAFPKHQIRFHIKRQMSCQTKEAAQQMFHGFEIIISEDALGYAKLIESGTFEDFVVERAFQRNQWSDMLIATDLTGSMRPYASQLLMWLKLNQTDQKVRQFVFFNDGNDIEDASKLVGQTGGIYLTKSNEYDKVERLARYCMKRGGGGDIEENDLEAVLAGLEKCPECRDIILIADNKSPVRDMVLLKDIDVPVRVIVCGSEGVIHPDYLNIARTTGGSVHLLEQDIFELMSYYEGQMVEIQGITYIIRDGKFQRKEIPLLE